MRLDEWLFQHGYAPSRSQAKQYIQEGSVQIDEKVIKKPGYTVPKDAEVHLADIARYVSRGAKKLAPAMRHFSLDPTDKIVADIGASTGGFTDYLLAHGAKKIYAIDIGKDQLAPAIKHDPRVISIEGVNVKNPFSLKEKVDFCVVDLSYISLTHILHNLVPHCRQPGGYILALIKPQFEAGPGVVGRDGVIKDQETVSRILETVLAWCEQQGFGVQGIVPSKLRGKKGNQEYFALLTPPISG